MSMTLHIDADALKPLIQEIVREVLAELGGTQGGDRLAFTESEAAERLGLARHQLRDQRRLGRITHTRGPGRRVLYRPADLAAYLERAV